MHGPYKARPATGRVLCGEAQLTPPAAGASASLAELETLAPTATRGDALAQAIDWLASDNDLSTDTAHEGRAPAPSDISQTITGATSSGGTSSAGTPRVMVPSVDTITVSSGITGVVGLQQSETTLAASMESELAEEHLDYFLHAKRKQAGQPLLNLLRFMRLEALERPRALTSQLRLASSAVKLAALAIAAAARQAILVVI